MKDRERFEAWMSDNRTVIHRMFQREGEAYCLPSTNEAWKLWQAAIASQQPADDGWIEWSGGECPVDASALVNVLYKKGGSDLESRPAGVYNWHHDSPYCYPIIAYRVVKQ